MWRLARRQYYRVADIDLNLLTALDVLLAERSVTAAAKRLGLSVSATSRTLARLREATGDPLLVQAGRRLVPTPHAEQLTDRVHALAHEAHAVLAPATASFDPGALDRTFTIRANEGFVTLFAALLVTSCMQEAPHVRLRFAPKPDRASAPLREGGIDLEVGTPEKSAPEMRSRLIFRDRFVGAVCRDHPLLAATVTPERYAACRHVVASRRGAWTGKVDDALGELGLRREVVSIVPGFLDALEIARSSDLVALVPRSCLVSSVSQRLEAFDLPVPTPDLTISAMWHPRLDADPAHRWMRSLLVRVCRKEAAAR